MMQSKNKIQNSILKESIFIIGSVSSVEGRRIKVEVKKDKNLSHISYLGQSIKNVSVGSYVKIAKGFIEIIGKVEGEYTSKEKVYNKTYKKEELLISRFLDVVLFGHFESSKFKQGIKEMPLINNEVYLLDKQEFIKLHQFYKDSEKTIKIGNLTEEPTQNIQLSISKLFASHIGIFGNTGSGKSNTLAKLYTELFNKSKDSQNFKKNSKFIFIDFNGEYTKNDLIINTKKVYNLSTGKREGDKFYIKKENIERLEVISVLLEATEKTQKPFLSRAIKNDFFDSNFQENSITNIYHLVKEIIQKQSSELSVSIFAELFSHLSQLEKASSTICLDLKNKVESGDIKQNSQNGVYITNSKYSDSDPNYFIDTFFGDIKNIEIEELNFGKLKFKILSRFYHEIINGYSNPEHIRPLMGRMFKKFNTLGKVIDVEYRKEKKNNTNLEIVNLKEVNLEMKKTLPLMIVKQLYDEHKEAENFDKKSLHIIVDEAHNILSDTSQRESETWKDYRLETFEEIIKEGRKFSTFLTISSQRPFDISPTIISQLHNYFIHRLINNNDILAIQKTVAYLDKLSFESIPVLSVGSCFVAGLASDIPVKVTFDLLPLEKQPRSETIDLENAWFNI